MTPSASNDVRAVYLIGCGGHGRVVLECLLLCKQQVRGILDEALPRGSLVQGIPVLGGDAQLADLDRRSSLVCIGVGVMPGDQRRAALFEDCRRRGLEFASVTHPSAVLSPQHQRAEGVQVLAGAVVQAGTRLGDDAIINTGACVDHDCTIGRGVMIGPGAILCGEVRIEAQAYIGAGAVVLPGVRVGAGAVIGAGSVVVCDVGDGLTFAGNPARLLSGSGGSRA
jgi:sugar O-acyltransferase (sialic acid O-acetyltransferase NeuD family)